jgi:hypothetical protein
MVSWKYGGTFSLVFSAAIAFACGSEETGAQGDGGSGGNDSGGRRGFNTGGTVGTTGGVLDRDALAENCAGMKVLQGDACSEAELVCQDAGGAFCVCGGLQSSSVERRPPGEPLLWECISIGGAVPEKTGGMGGSEPEATGGSDPVGAGGTGGGTGGQPGGGSSSGGAASGGSSSGGSGTGASGGGDLGGAAGASN